MFRPLQSGPEEVGVESFEALSINRSMSDDLVPQLMENFSSLQLSFWALPAQPSL